MSCSRPGRRGLDWLVIAGDRLALAAVEEQSVVLPRIEAPREVAAFHLGDPRSSLLAGVARELWSSTLRRPERPEPAAVSQRRPATRAASTFPPERITPILRPGIAPCSTAAIGSADVGSITSFVRDQTIASASRSASSSTSAIPAQPVAQDRERPLPDLQGAYAVGDRLRCALEPDALARRQRAMRIVARGRLCSPDRDAGRRLGAGERRPREQPAASDGRHHAIELGRVLAAARARPCPVPRARPSRRRVDQRPPALGSSCLADLFAVLGGHAVALDLGAIAQGGRDLRGVRVDRHHGEAADASRARRARHGLRVVAARDADDALGAPREARHGVRRTAELEAARAL